MTEYEEKLVGSEIVFQGQLLAVRVDTVGLPDGSYARREVVVHPGAVALVPLLGEEVILVRQWRQPLGRVTVELPAGTLNPGEQPQECARRELAEETGFSPSHLILLASVALTPGYSTEVIHIFLAEGLFPAAAQQDKDEKVSTERMALGEAVRQCLAGRFKDAKTIIGLLLAWHRVCGQAREGLVEPA